MRLLAKHRVCWLIPCALLVATSCSQTTDSSDAAVVAESDGKEATALAGAGTGQANGPIQKRAAEENAEGANRAKQSADAADAIKTPASQTLPSGWKIDNVPALAIGEPGDWDDFVVGSPCVLRVDDEWWMYYVGARLNEEGYSTGIGLATSRDGLTWQKQSPDWPLLAAEGYPDTGASAKEIGSPALCQLADGSFRMVYVEGGASPKRLKLARSEDGILWDRLEEADKFLAQISSMPFESPSLYAAPGSPGKLHLWFLRPSVEAGFNDLMHVESDDGLKWGKPVALGGKKFDASGTILHARFERSGESHVLSYLLRRAHREENKPARYEFLYRFRASRDLKTWVESGLPDLAPPGKDPGETHFGPTAAIFTAAGVRLLFDEQTREGGRHIRSALHPRSDDEETSP